jgi:Peptidase family M23
MRRPPHLAALLPLAFIVVLPALVWPPPALAAERPPTAAAARSPATWGRGAAGWLRPVAGAVVRGFRYGADPFRAGWHRGADLLVRAGTPVRSACPGRVAFAGAVARAGRAVTVRCGRWSVSYLPLARVSVGRGQAVRRGERLGLTAAPRHHPALHFGVRRTGSRFAYVDPLPFLTPPAAVPVVGPPPRRRLRPVGPSAPPRAAARARAAPAATPTRPLAPWPVWLGLALILAGAAGDRALSRRRTRTGVGEVLAEVPR